MRGEFPEEFDAIHATVLDPLVVVLRDLGSVDAPRDARSIHALTWELVAERMQGSKLTRAEARAHVLRFCLPALGLRA